MPTKVVPAFAKLNRRTCLSVEDGEVYRRNGRYYAHIGAHWFCLETVPFVGLQVWLLMTRPPRFWSALPPPNVVDFARARERNLARRGKTT